MPHAYIMVAGAPVGNPAIIVSIQRMNRLRQLRIAELNWMLPIFTLFSFTQGLYHHGTYKEIY